MVDVCGDGLGWGGGGSGARLCLCQPRLLHAGAGGAPCPPDTKCVAFRVFLWPVTPFVERMAKRMDDMAEAAEMEVGGGALSGCA